MPATATTFAAVLKDWFIGPVRKQMNDKTLMFRLANAASERVGGRQVVWPVHLVHNVGVGARAEGGTLPVAGEGRFVTATVPRRRWFGRIDLTSDVLKSSMSDRAAFASALTTEMEDVTNAGRNYFNRALYIGARGDLAEQASSSLTVSTTTVVVDLGRPLGNVARHLEVGMILDGLNASSSQNTTTVGTRDFQSITLTSVTVAASGTVSLTFSATVTIVSGTIFVHTGTGFIDFDGLNDAIAVSGTYFGVDRNDYRNRRWRGSVLGNAGTLRPFSENLLQSGWDAVSEAAGEEDLITNLVAHYSVRREYLSTKVPDVRFAPEDLRGGHKVLNFNGTPFHFEKDCPYNTIYGLDARALHFWKWSELEWVDEDGAILSRVTDVDRFEATLRFLANFGTDYPNHHFVIQDVQATL